MRAQLIVTFVMVTLDGGVLDRSVHQLDLAVCPRVVGFRKAMLDPIRFADHVEAHGAGIDGVPISRLLCELNAIIGQNSVDLVGPVFVKQVVRRFHAASLISGTLFRFRG